MPCQPDVPSTLDFGSSHVGVVLGRVRRGIVSCRRSSFLPFFCHVVSTGTLGGGPTRRESGSDTALLSIFSSLSLVAAADKGIINQGAEASTNRNALNFIGS
jgi:hypothetical protein